MRDSSGKGAEKEGSDVDSAMEPALPEESSSTSGPTPTPPQSGSSPVPEAAQPAAKTPSRSASPVPEMAAAPAPAAAAASDADVADAAPEVAVVAAAPVEPQETASAVKPESEPKLEPEPEAPAASAAPLAAPAPAPAPTPAAASVTNPMSSGASINFFSPPFALPSPPIMLPKTTSNKDKDKDGKEDKLVAARNEENSKVSGMRDDGSSDKRRTYLPEQWSPHNPEGKKKYDRNFLMDLRNDPQSQKKPDGLPDMEVVLKDGVNPKAMHHNFNLEFSPAGFVKNTGSRGLPVQRKSAQGNRQGRPGKPPVLHLSLSLREDVKLHETENAWKPNVLASSKESAEGDAKSQELFKRVRGVLNKLTPSKFDTLVGQVQALPIDTAERLKGVIDLVFDKAVDEPNFSVAYAKMCSELKAKEVEKSSFKKMLITRCQQEFEKSKDAENENKFKQEKLKEIQSEADPGKKKELQLMYEDEERKIRMKSVGNIRFIGELYKLGMLTGQIMLRCVSDLLLKEDEESLECLCKLLSTIGKKLEAELPQQDAFAPFFAKMKDLADKRGRGRNVSSRVRFMLQDCIDLRANKWIPRRDDSNPKTMDEIQKESERETLESTIALSQPNTPRKDDRRGMGMGGVDKRGGRGGMVSEDGWKQATSGRRTLDVSKLSKGLVQQPEPATLGSQSLFRQWGGGSGGSGGGGAARDNKFRTVTTGNSFSALDKGPVFNNIDRKTLSGPTSKDHSASDDRGSGSRSSSQQRMVSQPTSRDSSLGRGKLDEDVRNRVPTPSSLTDSSPGDDQPPSNVSGDSESGPVCKIKRIEDPEELERVAKHIIQEFLSLKSIEEAKLATMDYFDWTNIAHFTREVLAFMLDRLQGHQLVSEFLGHLINIKFMQKQHFFTGFAEVLDLCPELIVDIPKLWTHVGALLAYILLTEAVTFKDLAEPLKVLKGSKEAGLLLKNIIQVLVKEKGPSWIRDHWDRYGVSWSDFLEEKDVSDFVKENKFESFSGVAQASRTEMTRAEIEEKLLELLKSEVNFDAVQAWIESNIGERTKEPAFIRALMTAICKYAISDAQPSNKVTLNDEKLRQDKLLLRYVDNKEELELQCLYAVQALVVQLEYPGGLILSIFTTLWEDNLISTEAFHAWFNSDDPQESEGRGVCRKSLSSFLTHISEVEEEEEHP